MNSIMALLCQRTFTLLIAFIAFGPLASSADNVPNRTFELRTYTTTAAELDKLHGLFERHSGRFFIKYGIQVIALLTPQTSNEAPTQLVCLLAHESRATAIDNWRSFDDDSRWQQFVREAGVDPSVISQVEIKYFDPTFYSPMK